MQRKQSSFCWPWEVDRAVIVVGHLDIRCSAGVISCLSHKVLCEGGASGSVIQKKSSAGDALCNFLDTADKLGSEDQNVCFRELDAVFDLIRAVTEIQRHCDSACLENSKIDGKPVQAVHEKDRDLVAFNDTACDQHVRDTVCFLIKYRPGDLLTASDFVERLDQFIFFPCGEPGNLNIRIQFHKSYIIGPFFRVTFQKLCDRHNKKVLLYFGKLKCNAFKCESQPLF